jgi:hypothetical protein
MVTASIRGRDEAASRLATAIGWFWTVYTAAALVGIALADWVLPAWMAVLLALPAVLLVAAYALVIWALNPIRASFDPRVPQEIALAHAKASKAKQQRLAAATACALAAAVAVAAAVATTAATKPERTPSLRATHPARSDGANVILVRGQFSPGQEVTITVTPGPGIRGKAEPAKVLEVAGRDGVVRATVPVPIEGGYEATAAWNDSTGRWQVTRTVTVNTATTPPDRPRATIGQP